MPLIYSKDVHGPGTHALVIGVSRYRHVADGSHPTPRGEEFDIGQLTSAARSASEFAAWMLDEYRNPETPLASLRLLLSPSDGEQIASSVQNLFDPQTDYSATLAATKTDLSEFRAACKENRDNVAIVYIAGHGVQFTSEGAVVLLEDFACPQEPNLLSCAIDMVSCHAGMNHRNIAKTQFWFIDACRQRPEVAEKFESLANAFQLDELPGNVDVSPLILASESRESALAQVRGTSLFNQALLWALRGGAAQGATQIIDEWHIPAYNLFTKVKKRVSEIAAEYEEEQNVSHRGFFGEAAVHRFQDPPLVQLHISVHPPNMDPAPEGYLYYDGNEDNAVVSEYSNWPFEQPVQAGLYLLEVEPAAPFNKKRKFLNLVPYEHEENVEFQ